MASRLLGKTIEEKLILNSEKNENGCWIWKRSKTRLGYGNIAIGNGIVMRAHRASYMVFIGEIPRKKFVCHTCDNPSCVNPDHLFIGTQYDNMQDMIKKGRYNGGCYERGERHSQAQLTDKQVCEIKYLLLRNYTAQEIADRFGVKIGVVGNINENKSWKHIPWPRIRKKQERRINKHAGERNGRSLLTENQVIEIKKQLSFGKKQTEIASLYGVGKHVISYIKNGKTWTHV